MRRRATAKPAADAPSVLASAATVPEAPRTPSPSPAPPTETGPPVDLIHAVPSAVAASSVYRGEIDQVEKLVDGDLETAWNSRGGDLTAAWVEVRLPPEVAVTSIEMTAGFTRRTPRRDLFTSNHRVSRVRVTRDGAPAGDFPLDIESRALQALPVNGRGGVYRIEVETVEVGSRSDWREVCVSELRVMGHPNGAGPGGAPSFAVGTLPALPTRDRSDNAPTGSDGGDVATALSVLTSAWAHYESEQIRAEFNTGDPGVSPDEASGFVDARAELLEKAATIIETADATRAAALRRYASGNRSPWRWSSRRRDLDELVEAVDAFVHASGDTLLRCGWVAAHLGIRMQRCINLALWEQERTEWSVDEIAVNAESDDDPEVVRAERAAEAAAALYERLEDLTDDFADDIAATVPRVLAMDRPSSRLIRPEWNAFRAELTSARQRCGW